MFSSRMVPEVPDYVRNIFVEDNGQPPVPPARSSLNKTAIMEAEIREEKSHTQMDVKSIYKIEWKVRL